MSVESLKAALANYENILSFEEVGDVIKVKMEYQPGPKGKEKWDAINQVLKQFDGEWISEGKWSHWKVPKGSKQKDALPLPDILPEVRKLVDLLDAKLKEGGY